MKLNDVIINIPTGTRKNYNKTGLYVTNIIMQELANLFQLEQCYTFNVLDSYENKEKYLDFYLNNINNLSLNPNKIIVDCNFDIKNIMDYFVKRGLITSKIINHKICSCGRVDITHDFSNLRTKMFNIKNGKSICKMCGSECMSVERESLFLKLDRACNLDVYPLKYKNILDKQLEFFSSFDYLISKERNTGVTYEYNGKLFNLDIDFINYLMVAREEARKKIVISSTHLVKCQAITYMINNLFYPESNYTAYFHPYFINLDNTRERCFSDVKINTEIKIDELLYFLVVILNGNIKEEYKWNMDYYNKLKIFKDKKPEKFALINKILKNNIQKVSYEYTELDKKLSLYRNLLQTIFLKKLGNSEEELNERICCEINKKLYLK